MAEVEKWKKLERKEVFKHPRMHLVEDKVSLPNGEVIHYLLHAPSAHDSVATIAINDKQQILLQREFSYPPNEVMWQLPGGDLLQDEDIIEGARRELSEESGYDAKTNKIIGYFYTNNRRSDRKQHVVLCTDLVMREMTGDVEEFIESNWVDKKEIDAMVKSNEINNVGLLAALQLYSQNSL